MKFKKRIIFLLFLIFLISNSYSQERGKYVKRIKIAEDLLEYMLKTPDVSIPLSLIKQCYGIMFIRQIKAGFFLAGKGGEGIILAKDKKTGEWSPPAFIGTVEVSYGFQIGAQMTDLILLIMNEKGLNTLMKSKVRLGSDLSIAAGPVGREASGEIAPIAALLAYGRSKGAFGGISLKGGIIFSDDKANEEFYGKKGIKISDIIFKKQVPVPKEAEKLIKLLKDYEEYEIVIEKPEKKKEEKPKISF